MKVSVITPTYNGVNKLPAIFKALEAQSFNGFDVLVVIDGSTDNTLDVLHELKTELNFKIIEQENRGRASVRNKGAETATGDLLIFFDDDMLPETNCIEEHIAHHKIYEQSLMSGAQIDDIKKAVAPFQKYKCYLSEKWAEPLRKYEGSPLPLTHLHLTAANFSIPKKLFEQLGGFDEKLKDNEDLDLAIRAHQLGYPVYYRHSAFAWHRDYPTCKSFIKRQREYKVYHNYAKLNNKEAYKNLPRFSEKESQHSFFKKIFYSFWKGGIWVSLTDKGFFNWLPKTWQYNIYNWIVYANVEIEDSKNQG